MARHGCRYGAPHDLYVVGETRTLKVERCLRCPASFRWVKGYKERVDNKAYLEAHARNYAQRGGATNRLFMRLYEPEKCKIFVTL
jgi:hypothetical protein